MPVTIDLEKPVPGHGADVVSITFRDPVFDDWAAVGRNPDTYVHGPNNTFWQQVDVDAIKQYADRLVVDVRERQAIARVSLPDAMKIRDLILGFFEKAEPRSTKSETPSSSTTASPPTSSGE